MSTITIRTMLVDCILHYRKVWGCWYPRPYTNETILNTNVDIENLSIASCVELCKNLGVDQKSVYIYPNAYEDSDGYPEHHVELSIHRKVSDEEWFEEISNSISPKWVRDRYYEYLRLKDEFE